MNQEIAGLRPGTHEIERQVKLDDWGRAIRQRSQLDHRAVVHRQVIGPSTFVLIVRAELMCSPDEDHCQRH